ncbi:hypothetical protein [Clostridium sp. OS1-26]|uniref:hypothetical protein n=1 Tax=Clostridium sp. OS1-26 TaxID=3070681 RepID=UPI0027E0FBFB|nr:hypothetical protein [Clostridium sp. OS1-26]WML33134.1 hypothetical protein RCG18_17480 [Clostridium sp. OS1-26]
MQHDDFIKKIKNADIERIDHNQDGYLMEVLEFFMEWISGHILATDMDYVKYKKSLS